MDERLSTTLQEYADRIWPQAETVLQNLFAYFDTMGERYEISEEDRLQVVNRFLGEDFAENYANWMETSE